MRRAAAIGALGLALAGGIAARGWGEAAKSAPVASPAAQPDCGSQTSGISLPPGFCATVFAEDVGHPRHMAVGADGTLYVNTWSGSYFRTRKPAPPGGFLLALKDANHDGHADAIERFGPTEKDGDAGGTGIGIYHDAIYAEANDKIVRYPIPKDGSLPKGPPRTILSGMPIVGGHNMHPFVIDANGGLFVNMGSESNACQARNRMIGSPGQTPCTELRLRGGVWRYDAETDGQKHDAAHRFVTGLRNSGGIAIDAGGRMFAVQHGRDQLSQNWPQKFTAAQGAELPAEVMVELHKDADYGWPFCYYDGPAHSARLAPEYGGDGKAVGLCATKEKPVAAYAAHMAPMDIAFYDRGAFPAAYRGGAFIAFHGSWNRAPAPQEGYKVMFQPMRDGRVTGPAITFADGFAGGIKDPGQALHRPAGLAVAPDGALFVSDDASGRIWRITYRGAPTAKLTPAAAPRAVAQHKAEAPLTPPPGFTAAQVALGDKIFHGLAQNGTCSGCHGGNARGSAVGPDLAGGRWLWGNGSVEALRKTITEGVPTPKEFNGVMPPKGGADLSPADVDAVAAYLWALNHRQ